MNQAEELPTRISIEIERQDDGSYAAWKVTTTGNKSVFDPIKTEQISKPIPYGESVQNWANNLNGDELEAAILIFTERWTWDTGLEEDRICLEALEEERKFRNAPLHSHEIPAHTHNQGAHTHNFGYPITGTPRPVNPSAGEVWTDPVTFQSEVFDGNHWHPVRLTAAAGSYTSVAGPQGMEHSHSIAPNFVIQPFGKSSP